MEKLQTDLAEAVGNLDSPVGANWGQERRLEFIDFRLRWEKTVNRADLRSHFGISIPQASLDIAKYAQMAPQNLVYDRSTRTYRVGAGYAPAVGNTTPHRYLNEVLACSRGLLDARDAYIGWMPPFAGVPVLTRLVESEVLSMLLDAIRHEACVRITYQSDSEADPIERVISPHAFGHDGFRWHVRAYCFLREGYRDFVLGRILTICTDATQGRDPKLDVKWHTILPVKIAANPSLTEGNRRAVELDYSMFDGTITIDVREALLYYVLKELRLGPFAFPGYQRPQIVLLNNVELSSYIEQMLSSPMRESLSEFPSRYDQV
jgi:hypothetical protein